ncbi:MAG: PIN domain protein [Candidatus Methanoperedens nitroreducens]|uniref:PIN domain protein n=1 Tax=Candidatus Methanoperedens nitratireducens TaxID=1392998 RepID=A0A0P8E3C4_9EURY|nr:type II toxin-antitoxin system VapC family toxin [Candidatus Methanoperedens sp. BLZ2]KAB2944277.1 MAG: type II toxin-antitoxin system VapC family toxin [Candidatus Methanoperedens sp.]KPQ44964.1 MAG: PIN domain protein [Candidatus Methanoperedens sp. BLZ1]MBZ0174887.1 type II toxin-antitoxin system VapC family toxin [Candidatus Methanoperedens nitroreducens]MCX9078820.1 type II toxin-antitoxin system VapC family toxin [Candidatus Methanoperedens sp.]
MKFLLDTNICIYLLNGNEILKKKIGEIGIYSLSISNATLAELYFGAYNSRNVSANMKRIETFKKNLIVYSDSSASAEAFGRFKSKLKAQGQIIEDFDILIASIAYANECILVTNNPIHFERIDEIKIENWMEKDRS